jgi:HD-GYP domain-containing protein (c-di-GMP phosphodiesterase class II)
VRFCHERYDGGGYPDGLVGDEIPIIARIVCCCDAFNAMTTTRPYRAAMSLAEARAELELNRGTQFDPDVVDAVLALTSGSIKRQRSSIRNARRDALHPRRPCAPLPSA